MVPKLWRMDEWRLVNSRCSSCRKVCWWKCQNYCFLHEIFQRKRYWIDSKDRYNDKRSTRWIQAQSAIDGCFKKERYGRTSLESNINKSRLLGSSNRRIHIQQSFINGSHEALRRMYWSWWKSSQVVQYWSWSWWNVVYLGRNQLQFDAL